VASAAIVRSPTLGSVSRLPAACFAATVLAQIAYPLTGGDVRNGLTIATVLLWTATSLSHAALTRGRAFAGGLLVVSAGIGFAAEVIGTATGVPFGSYSYTGGLGPQWAGVPVIIPLAWVMMAYPAWLVGRLLGRPVLYGAGALAAWDLFLDPQMVGAGHWAFTGGGPRLNGIPLTNTAGWLLVALVIMTVIERLPGGAQPADDRLPYALYLWTYASSVLAAAAFFHRPGVAVVGGIAMGLPAVALVRVLRERRRTGSAA
jgi:putative membrane protein